MRSKLDEIDLRILTELQSDGRMTNVELASRVGISPPPCLRPDIASTPRVDAMLDNQREATTAAEAMNLSPAPDPGAPGAGADSRPGRPCRKTKSTLA